MASGPSIELRILSQLPEPHHQITLADLPVVTTVGNLKLMIQEQVPANPLPQNQRLIYRGRMLRDEDTLQNVLGANTATAGSSHTFHLVVRDMVLPTIAQSRLTPSSATVPESLASTGSQGAAPAHISQTSPPSTSTSTVPQATNAPHITIQNEQGLHQALPPPPHPFLPFIPQMIQQPFPLPNMPPHMMAHNMAHHTAMQQAHQHILQHHQQMHHHHHHHPAHTTNQDTQQEGTNQSGNAAASAVSAVPQTPASPPHIHVHHTRSIRHETTGPNGERISVVMNATPFGPGSTMPFNSPPNLNESTQSVGTSQMLPAHTPEVSVQVPPSFDADPLPFLQQLRRETTDLMHTVERTVTSSAPFSTPVDQQMDRLASLIRTFNRCQQMLNARRATPNGNQGSLSESDLREIQNFNDFFKIVLVKFREFSAKITQVQQSASPSLDPNAFMLRNMQGTQGIIHGPGASAGSVMESARTILAAHEALATMNRDVAAANHAVVMMNHGIANASNAIAAANRSITTTNQRLAALGMPPQTQYQPAPRMSRVPSVAPEVAEARAADRRQQIEQLHQQLLAHQDQVRAVLNGNNRPEDPVDIIRALTPLLRHLWLVIRIAGMVWFFSHGMSTSQTALLAAAGVVYFVAQAGLFGVGDVWAGIRNHFDQLIGPPQEQPAANGPLPQAEQGAPNGNEGAQVAQTDVEDRTTAARGIGTRGRRRYRPDPQATADRLLRERREANQGWMRERLRTVERATALFFASLYPGVGERHVAEQERRERQAREIEEAARRAEAEAQAQAIASNTAQQDEGAEASSSSDGNKASTAVATSSENETVDSGTATASSTAVETSSDGGMRHRDGHAAST